ncbi:hypothetical protein P9112_000758 [Eukaryota sp. TZLM1-RC]
MSFLEKTVMVKCHKTVNSSQIQTPSDLFTNTKLMYRPCTLKHSDTLKAEYEKARKTRDYGFEREALRTLERIVSDCDKRIDRFKNRLEEEKHFMSTEVDTTIEPPPEISMYSSQIQQLIPRIKDLGEAGELERSFELFQEAEELREKKFELELQHQQLTVSAAKGSQAARIRVCDVCGARLSITDTDKRLADHFGGKLHLGFVKVRQKVKELSLHLDVIERGRDRKRRYR